MLTNFSSVLSFLMAFPVCLLFLGEAFLFASLAASHSLLGGGLHLRMLIKMLIRMIKITNRMMKG